jgi:hypothetical protein
MKKTYVAGGTTILAAALALSLGACASPPSDLAAGAPDVDKATQMTSNITNNTKEDLTLVSASHAGGVTHWQDQAPKTLAAGTTAKVTDYGSGDNSMTIVYEDASGAQYTFKAKDPMIGDNSSSATTTSTQYTTTASNSSGHDDWTTFTVAPGHTFDFTGSEQSYTVPAGVTELNVDLTGGAGQSDVQITGGQFDNGAEIQGTLAVTPGEVLTIGVGGTAGSDGAGGWGMSFDGSTFAGGDAADIAPVLGASGGGGASVIIVDGQIVAVAGGSGGYGQMASGETNGAGGLAGKNGSLTGTNGGPGTVGGAAGANTVTQGESVTSANTDSNPGGGGGGYQGGKSGMDGSYGGGGAGSSYDAGLTDPTVKNSGYWANGEQNHPGRLILSAVNS